eukprot:gene12214-12352_t
MGANSSLRGSLEDRAAAPEMIGVAQATGAAAFKETVPEDEEPQEHVTAVTQAVEQLALPDWTFQPSALQDLWVQGPGDEQADGDGDAESEDLDDLDWSKLLPCYSPSLLPLVKGLPGMEVMHLLSSKDITKAFSDGNPATLTRQMQEISEVRRLQYGVTPELLQQLTQLSTAHRRRRLFQPTAYTPQEALQASATDVAAVVEVLCGKPNPATPSAITGTIGLEDPAPYWQAHAASSEQQQQQQMLYKQAPGQQPHSESIGQISSCILVKLIIDLWLTAGPAAAFPLVLRMLQQALYQPHPDYRARAFDIVYNLSLHGCMLLRDRPAAVEAGHGHSSASHQAAGSSPVLPHHQQQQQQQDQRSDAQGLLSRRSPHHLAAAGTSTPLVRQQSDAAGSSSTSVASEAGGASDPQGSPSSHNSSGCSMSPSPSPRIHLPPQLLAQLPPSPLQAAAAAASSNWQLSSPKGRSRLSRSELRSSADRAAQQQQQGSGKTSTNNPAAAMTPGESGKGQGADRQGVEVGIEPAGGTTSPRSLTAAWASWLQQLLYELLLMLSELQEPCEAVWQSALGCLMHLTTRAGLWVAGKLTTMPPAAAAALLDACITFNWSHELHAQLVEMSVNLLYVSGPAATWEAEQCGSGKFWQEEAEQPQAKGQPAVQQQVTAGGSRFSALHCQLDSVRQPSHGTCPGSRALAWEDDLPPHRLHGGPVDKQQLAALGGPQKLLQHFCHAASTGAQRTLMVPLLQVLMPHDIADAAQLAILQVLCSSPNCLAALQTALSAGVPGWAQPVLAAITQQLTHHELDQQLLAAVLLQLEDLGLPEEVEVAMQVTLLHLAGQVPSLPQVRPGLQGTEAVVYQTPPEAQGCWKALKALCWCDDEDGRRVAKAWLQRLLQLMLEQSLKGAILLPLPGVSQHATIAPSPPPAFDAGKDAVSAAAAAAGIHAACEAWVDVLQQLVAHCPRGPDMLVDALQLLIISCKLRPSSCCAGGPAPAAATGFMGLSLDATGARAQQPAAVARMCVQAWAFVCQWVMQARTSSCQAALTRLAAMAQGLSCAIDLPLWFQKIAASAAVPGPHGREPAPGDGSGMSEHQAGPAAGRPGESSRDTTPGALLGDVGTPPPEPSAEPSAFAGLGARDDMPESKPWSYTPEAAAAVLAAAEAVCWPQAFLLGRVLLPQDLQLALLLMLMSSCSMDAESVAEYGLQAVTQQVLSTCSDPRACLLLSQFMLEHLMKHHQERYWESLKQLVVTAQQADDERLLGNPFLQL